MRPVCKSLIVKESRVLNGEDQNLAQAENWKCRRSKNRALDLAGSNNARFYIVEHFRSVVISFLLHN